MKEIQTEKGVLKYRLPDIAEGYYYLSLVDVIRTASDVFNVQGKIIKMMGDLIDFKELGYSSYQEMLNDKENMRKPLGDISKEIFDDILELLEKKA